ncbi:MAG: AsmA family protein [Acidobacteriia bacterium]|nr:AsmA family protein [Terriglobia bacterium]
MMRRVGIAIGIILGIIIVAVAVFAATFNVNRYRGTIQSQLEQRLVRTVTLGEMHLSLFPPRFGVQNLAIADDPTFAAQKPFVEAQQLDVSVKLFPLLKGNVEIDSLDLQRPSVELIKNQQGIWNFSSLGGPSVSSKPDGQQPLPGGPSESSDRGGRQFSLAKLVISDGQVAVTDLQGGKPRALYDHIDASVRDFTSNAPFSLDVAAHLPGPGTQEIRLQGQVGPIVRDQPAATPFHGTLDMKQVEIASLRKFLDSPALANADGVLSGQAKISSESGALAANGKLNVQNARVSGRALGYSITADYDIRDDLTTDVLTISSTTLTLGTTPIVVNGTVNTKPTPAQLDLRVKADNVSIAEAASLAAASGVGLAPGATVSGNVSADIRARGAASKPALSGAVSGRNVQISGKDIPQPVGVRSINLALTPSEIHSDDFNVTSGGTTLVARFALQQYLSKSPMVDARLRASDAGLPEVLSMAKAYGVTPLDKISGAGKLNMDVRATGPLQTLTSADVVRTLNGTLNLNCNSIRYTGIDVGYQLASIGGFLKSAEKDQGFTNISRMTGDILVKNGVAQSNNVMAQLDVGSVGAAGTANLVNQALDLRLTAVLSKDFSQRSGGTSVGGYLTTALANNQGELVIPAIVTGTFQNPKFSPDLQRVAQMKLKGLMPSSSNPLGGAAGLLGGLLGQKGGNQTQPQQPQQQQPQQANPVQQLIDIFGGKKKQQEQPPPK